ncbi:MAG TPA: flagellar motor switch protein FliG [Syntrophobacteraceae bacterium]|nr:flagellar motor switch protein FliG [Syntrophobacteraceae bacterium]
MAKLTGPQKAAAFLMFIGEKSSAQLLKSLTPEEIKQLGSCMCDIQEVKKEVVDEVLQEFGQMYSSKDTILTTGGDFFFSLLPSVVAGEAAQEIISGIEKEREAIPFKHVRDVDPKVLAGFIKTEHPQTIAIILAHLEPSRAGQVLALLPEPLQFEVLNRIARLETVPPDLLREVDQVLQEELLSVEKGSNQTMGGVQIAAEILNNSDKRTEESILQALENHDEEMAERIRKLMFVFEDLVGVNDSGIRELLKEVNSKDLTMALKTASEELKKKILGNLSKRAAQILQEDLSVMGPVRLSEVEAAQQNIINTARRLEKEGKLFLMGGEGGDTLV